MTGNKCHEKGTQYSEGTIDAIPFDSLQEYFDAAGEPPK
jgi:hypothetical protein